MGQRRITITWLVLFALLLAAFAGTVLVLNATLYSASGFVGSYLGALARHDVKAAVELAGAPAQAVAKADPTLLDPRALGTINDIHLLSDTQQANGEHLVRYGYTLSGTAASTSFTVKYDGARLGLFSGWRFSTSPIAVFSITPEHEPDFTVNDLPVTSKTGASAPRKYRALVPGRYVLGHTSTWFTAAPKPVSITKTGVTSAVVDIEANDKFVGEVQKEVDSYLKKCATQKVLLPTGCPFGKQIDNRIQGLPAWSMSTYPKIAISPGEKPGSWTVAETPAAAHLTVKIQSIFDGTVSNFDEAVPFTVRYNISFQPDGELLIAGY
jgi:hypothetical protein